MLLLKLLLLIILANGGPILAKRLLGRRYARPVDGGRILADGRPVFGPSKTLRGVLAAVLVAAVAAPMLGLSWWAGAAVGAAAMAGDLLSSFIKRRMGLTSGAQALGLDQIPEALLPALVLLPVYPLSLAQLIALVGAFVFLELALSALLYRLRIRDRPY